jgi:hypothetical protein
MKQTTKPQTRLTVWQEADGYHWQHVAKGESTLDARGPAYPSRAAARRAAKRPQTSET